MRKISIYELKKFVATVNWTHRQEVEYKGCSSAKSLPGGDRVVGEDREYLYGAGKMVSVSGDITVTRSGGFGHYDGEPDTFMSGNICPEDRWKIEGIQVIDHEGEPAHISDFCGIFEDHFPSIDYSSITSSI